MIFNNTTIDPTKRIGLIEGLEDLTGTQSTASGSYPLDTKTKDINLAFDEYMFLANTASGTQQADDYNQTGRDFIEFDLVQDQADYQYTVDGQGNQIEAFYRLEMRLPDDSWILLEPTDEMSETIALAQLETLTGIPSTYSKSGNVFTLNVKPNYSKRIGTEGKSGFRMYITRAPSYFVSTDTTKSPGIPNGHHRYLILLPALWFWLPKDTARANIVNAEVVKYEQRIKKYYSDRKKDEQDVITSECVNPY